MAKAMNEWDNEEEQNDQYFHRFAVDIESRFPSLPLEAEENLLRPAEVFAREITGKDQRESTSYMDGENGSLFLPRSLGRKTTMSHSKSYSNQRKENNFVFFSSPVFIRDFTRGTAGLAEIELNRMNKLFSG